MRAILKGTPYPQNLLIATINAIRADQKINYLRAAIIKAVLVRRARILKLNELEIKMSLDKENTEPAYLTGRLFASLEKLQEEAHEGKLKRTIRDSYYGSASAAPRSVFPVLIKLKNHHIGKLGKLEKYGRRIFFEKLFSEIYDKIEARQGFPSHFTLEQQGLFSIGYYHQRQYLFPNKSEESGNE